MWVQMWVSVVSPSLVLFKAPYGVCHMVKTTRVTGLLPSQSMRLTLLMLSVIAARITSRRWKSVRCCRVVCLSGWEPAAPSARPLLTRMRASEPMYKSSTRRGSRLPPCQLVNNDSQKWSEFCYAAHVLDGKQFVVTERSHLPGLCSSATILQALIQLMVLVHAYSSVDCDGLCADNVI